MSKQRKMYTHTARQNEWKRTCIQKCVKLYTIVCIDKYPLFNLPNPIRRWKDVRGVNKERRKKGVRANWMSVKSLALSFISDKRLGIPIEMVFILRVAFNLQGTWTTTVQHLTELTRLNNASTTAMTAVDVVCYCKFYIYFYTSKCVYQWHRFRIYQTLGAAHTQETKNNKYLSHFRVHDLCVKHNILCVIHSASIVSKTSRGIFPVNVWQ